MFRIASPECPCTLRIRNKIIHFAAVKHVAACNFIVDFTLARVPNEDLEARASFVLLRQHHGIVKSSRAVALKHATLNEQCEGYS